MLVQMIEREKMSFRMIIFDQTFLYTKKLIYKQASTGPYFFHYDGLAVHLLRRMETNTSKV